MNTFFVFQVTQSGIEPGHPRTLFPDDVIRDTIGNVGLPIYVVNEVLFIYNTLLNLHMYIIYKLYNIHIRYIRCIFFLFSGDPA